MWMVAAVTSPSQRQRPHVGDPPCCSWPGLRPRVYHQQGGAPNQPLGSTVAPNGDAITVNGGDGNAVETSRFHGQVATATLDTAAGAGSLFGIALTPNGRGLYFVDDGTKHPQPDTAGPSNWNRRARRHAQPPDSLGSG